MDPNAVLKSIRDFQVNLRDQESEGYSYDHGDVGVFLDQVEALDDWLSEGGFLPSSWQPTDFGTGV